MPVWAVLARRARKATGLTQEEFAELIGASRSTIGCWEAAIREPSKLAVSLLCLVEALGREAIPVLHPCHAAVEAENVGVPNPPTC